jgi:hypothetical protein
MNAKLAIIFSSLFGAAVVVIWAYLRQGREQRMKPSFWKTRIFGDPAALEKLPGAIQQFNRELDKLPVESRYEVTGAIIGIISGIILIGFGIYFWFVL